MSTEEKQTSPEEKKGWEYQPVYEGDKLIGYIYVNADLVDKLIRIRTPGRWT